jgi:exosome complex component RRP40
VDIGGPTPAILSNIAFNSATKRHRPNLKVGQVVICHVTASDPLFDIEVSCEDPTSQKDWVTNEVYFGALPEGGLMLSVSSRVAIELMAKNNPIFPVLGRHFKPFELAVGANGRIYVKTAEGEYLRAILIRLALMRCSSMSLEDFEKLCQDMEHRLSV